MEEQTDEDTEANNTKRKKETRCEKGGKERGDAKPSNTKRK